MVGRYLLTVGVTPIDTRYISVKCKFCGKIKVNTQLTVYSFKDKFSTNQTDFPSEYLETRIKETNHSKIPKN